MIEAGTTPTYRVTIHFQDRRKPSKVTYDHNCPACRAHRPHREWSKGGYTWEDAMDVKTWFLEDVPPAVFGSMEPEGSAR
jgi:hypothetical protein